MIASPWFHLAVACFVIVAASAPMIFSYAALYYDPANLVLGVVRGHELTSGFPPTSFLSGTGSGGVLMPTYIFYGGPLYSLLGLFDIVPGLHGVPAFVLFVAIGQAFAYGGTFWFSRQCGIPRHLSHVPAIAVITSAYWTSDLYARADFAEYMAINSLPLVAASILDLQRNKELRLRTFVALFFSVVVFSGSHNLTLEWGSTLGVVAFALFALTNARRWKWRWQRIAYAIGVVAVGIGANAWALLPDAAYGSTTAIATVYSVAETGFLDSLGVLFNPLRYVPAQSGTQHLYLQLPVWFLAWAALVGLFLAVRTRRASWRVLGNPLACLAVGALVLYLIVTGAALSQVPAPLSYIQFPYRLGSYLVFTVAGLLVIVIRWYCDAESDRTLSARSSVTIKAALVAVTLMSSALFAWQLRFYFASSPANVLQSNAIEETKLALLFNNQYADVKEPIVNFAPRRTFDFALSEVSSSGNSLIGNFSLPGGGAPIATNIVGGPQFVTIGGGIIRIGRTPLGYAIVKRLRGGNGPVHVVLRAAHPLPTLLGDLASGLSWGIALLVGILTALSRLRSRSRRRIPSPTTVP
jgi:hypothetical protein